MRRGPRAASAAVVAAALIATGALVVHRRHVPHAVAVAGSALHFELPHDWQDARRDQDPSRASVVEVARQQGFTPQQYVERLASVTKASAAGPPADGYVQTVDVQVTDLTALPDPATVAGRLEAVHEQVVSTRTASTRVGPVVVTRYRVPLAAHTLAGDLVHVAVAGKVYAIYIGSAREDLLGPLTREVLASLAID